MSDMAWPVAPPPVPITEVWVAVIVVHYEVSVRNAPATEPLSSRAALFAPRATDVRTSAKVVAAATTEQECRQLLAEWKADNPGTGGEEIVSAVALGRSHDEGGVPAPPPSARCIECGTTIGAGFYCEPCQKKEWAKAREADAELEAATG